MSWLSDRLGIHVNLRPLAAPAGALVGGLLGGPLGAGIGAGLFKTADNKLHGDSWGHALGQGALNGVGYGAGAALMPKIAGIGRDATAAPEAAGAANDVPGYMGQAAINAPGSTAGAAVAGSTPGQSMSSQLLSGLKGVGSAIKDNPLVVGQTASGILNARQGSANLDFEKQQYADEQERRKRIAALLGPAYEQMMASRPTIAPNPYTGR